MIQAIFYGFLAGLFIGITLYGPAFFLLLQVALKQSRLKAILFSLGVLSGDFLIILLSIFGLSAVFESDAFNFWFSLIGGLVLIGLGAYLFLQKSEVQLEEKEVEEKGSLLFWVQGFFFNIVNPLAYLYWISMIGGIQSSYQLGRPALITSLVSLLMGLFVVDLVKITVAGRIQKLMTPKRLSQITKVLAIVLFLFGIKLLFRIF